MKTVSIRVSDEAHKKLQDHYVATGISITRAASDCIVRHVYWGTKGAPKKDEHEQGGLKMTRVHVTVSNVERVAGHRINCAMKTSDGTYRGTIDLDDSDDVEYIDELLQSDENVVEYSFDAKTE